MSEPRKTPPAADNELAEKTLRFLGKLLRLRQFLLRSQVRARKTAERNEAKTRKEIRNLTGRIQRELDAHPTLFKGAKPDDFAEEG